VAVLAGSRRPDPGSWRAASLAARLGALVAMGAAALLVAVCSGDGGDPAPDPAVEEVRALLRARGARLAAGDAEGYLRAAVGEARALEEAIARGGAAVPLSVFRVAFNPAGPPRAGTARFRDAPVQVTYGYDGLPAANRFRFSLRYTLERRDGAWVITGARPDPSPERPGDELPVWAAAPTAATRSTHFLFLHPPDLGEVGRVAELAEAARSRLEPRLRFGSPDPVHLVVLARDTPAFEAVTGGADGGAFAFVRLVYPAFSPPEGRHMVVHVGRVLGLDGAGPGHAGEVTPVAVFQHELAHLALSQVRGAEVPSWVEEGAAMYLAGERREGDWRGGLAEGAFEDVALAGFGDGYVLASGDEYAYVNAAVSWLVDEYGEARLWDFYRSFLPTVGAVVAAADGPASFLFPRWYGFDLAELDRRTRAFLAAGAAGG